MNLEIGTYYQDILEDGSRSDLRQNFPVLKRVSYDKRPAVARTLVINVTQFDPAVSDVLELTEEVGLHLDPKPYDSREYDARVAGDALFKKEPSP
jgi:hypothetical protein